MISGIFHKGSGLGNQLHRYVATRVLADSLGVEFGMVAPENFKGSSFMNLDMGVPVKCTWSVAEGGKVVPISSMASFEERKIVENGVDVRGYDPEFNFIQDNTIIDGEFQDERYFHDMLVGYSVNAKGELTYGAYGPIGQWLQTAQLGMPNDLCILGFRGGEFTAFPDLFLTREYWDTAMAEMRKENPNMKFMAVTDDPETARAFLPAEVKITHEISEDWRKVRYARYLIISNSSFYIFPSLLNNNVKKVIAPRYWARRNTGVWACPSNFYQKFTYI